MERNEVFWCKCLLFCKFEMDEHRCVGMVQGVFTSFFFFSLLIQETYEIAAAQTTTTTTVKIITNMNSEYSAAERPEINSG